MSAVFLRHRPTEKASVPGAAGEVVAEFSAAHGRAARLWLRSEGGWTLLPDQSSPVGTTPAGAVAEVPEVGGALWVEVEKAESDDASTADTLAGFLAGMVSRVVRHSGEVDFFSRELSERYEEITLLYSISEILGSVISLERAAGTILEEVVGVLEAKRASLWVHHEETDTLVRTASVGSTGAPERLEVDDPVAVTSKVFRDCQAVILEPDEVLDRSVGTSPDQHDSVLSVPLSYSPPEGESRTVGVINLIGRRQGGMFTAGDLKLLAAIASQIGAALENGRLISTTVRQERVLRELELAHDLQLKLLPAVDRFREVADVAAACRPAESVGGDFYHLFRLGEGRIGVMIGDVSTHGFRAALIMALAMSAVAVHAAEGDAPARVLERVRDTILEELRSTEMYITVVYAVIDPSAGTLTYCNAGHPYAYRIGGSEAERLGATDPPLGLVDAGELHEREVPWIAGRDLLLLFTDGITDALDGDEGGSPEQRVVDRVMALSGTSLAEIVEDLVDLPSDRRGVPADDRTALLLRV